jgi:hypothetical protein
MAPNILLQDATSDLCTEFLDAMRDLRSACSRRAYFLSKYKTKDLTNAPAMLHKIAASLRAREVALILLRNEIESALPLEDLRSLSKSAEDAIYELQLFVESSGRHTLGIHMLLSIAEDLCRLHDTAVELSAACTTLDDELCPHPRRWSEGSPATPSNVSLAFT